VKEMLLQNLRSLEIVRSVHECAATRPVKIHPAGPLRCCQSASDCGLGDCCSLQDLGSGFALVDERGTESFQDKDLRSASQRLWQGESSFVQATVLVWKQPVGDSPTAVLAGFDKPFRQNTSTPAKFTVTSSASCGRRLLAARPRRFSRRRHWPFFRSAAFFSASGRRSRRRI
jgi:hypothetical protein